MTWGPVGRPAPGNWKTLKAKVLRDHHGTCHTCHHDQAEQVDHIVGTAQWARERRTGSPHALTNLAPIHQAPCPTCGRECHKTKTAAEAIAGRAARHGNRTPEPHPGALR